MTEVLSAHIFIGDLPSYFFLDGKNAVVRKAVCATCLRLLEVSCGNFVVIHLCTCGRTTVCKNDVWDHSEIQRIQGHDYAGKPI